MEVSKAMLAKGAVALSVLGLAQSEWKVSEYGVDRATAKMLVTVIGANMLAKMGPCGYLDTACKVNLATTAIQTYAVLKYLGENSTTVQGYVREWKINSLEIKGIWLGLTALIARYGLNTKY